MRFRVKVKGSGKGKDVDNFIAFLSDALEKAGFQVEKSETKKTRRINVPDITDETKDRVSRKSGPSDEQMKDIVKKVEDRYYEEYKNMF